MSDDIEDPDVNKAFENLLLAEDIAEKKGYKEGFTSGKNQLIEGYHLGYHRGSAIAAQLGYYYGVLIHINKTNNVPKIESNLVTLMENIKRFPIDNSDVVDIFDRFENIKLKFKMICSLAKVDAEYPESNKLEF